MNNAQPNCPCCGKGLLESHFENYTLTTKEGLTFVVPEVEVQICTSCNEKTLPLESALAIERYISEQNEQLSPPELRKIRIGLGVDQTQMSEILGLGGKTFHRWEKGIQVPSRSMGYYLRLLQEFPEAFDWLRERRWREEKIVSVDFKNSFPALYALPQKNIVATGRNAARALLGS